MRNSPMEETPLRAMLCFDHLPFGHKTFAVTRPDAEPHLKVGEFAVVDMTDRELQHGELYLWQSEFRERRRLIVQVFARMINDAEGRCAGWYHGQLRMPRRIGDIVYTGMIDGPYERYDLQGNMLGRIVGYSDHPLGAPLAQEAGAIDAREGS